MQGEIRKEQKGLYLLLEALSSDVFDMKDDVSTLKDDMSIVKAAVVKIARRFTNLDKLSAQTVSELDDL